MKIYTSLLLMISFNILSAEGNNIDGRHHGPHGEGPKFTEEQKSCLKNFVGEPGRGERPTREKMEAALKSCGIEKPARPDGFLPKDDE